MKYSHSPTGRSSFFAGTTPFDDFMTSDSLSVTLNHLEGDNTWCFLFPFPFARESFAVLVSKLLSSLSSSSPLLGFHFICAILPPFSIVPQQLYSGSPRQKGELPGQHGESTIRLVCFIPRHYLIQQYYTTLINGKSFTPLGTQRNKSFVG